VGFEQKSPHSGKVGSGLFSYTDTTGVYPTAAGFFDAIDRNTPCNIAVLAGHCTARTSVAGYENRTLTEEEQLLNGGHRLAYILNSIFDGK
jgi:N-acyl-D-amino-acid deacylase